MGERKRRGKESGLDRGKKYRAGCRRCKRAKTRKSLNRNGRGEKSQLKGAIGGGGHHLKLSSPQSFVRNGQHGGDRLKGEKTKLINLGKIRALL